MYEIPDLNVLQHKEEQVNQIHQEHHLVAQPQPPLQAEFSAKKAHSSILSKKAPKKFLKMSVQEVEGRRIS